MIWDKFDIEQAEFLEVPASMLFKIGELYPHPIHKPRIQRYRENKKLFAGNHYEVFERAHNRLSKTQRDIVYVSANLAGIVCKKSADFLFGESPVYSAGGVDDSPEQNALERLVMDNDLNITNYESAMGNAYRGDSFYKIRYGQEFGGMVPKEIDPLRVFIESQNPEYVFPEVSPMNAKVILAYHIAFPSIVANSDGSEWILNVESHFPGRIIYRKFRMRPYNITVDSEVDSWKIYAEIPAGFREVLTGVPLPLVVHVPNYGTDDTWQGIDDLSEIKPLLDELNNRLSLLAVILDKHSDPAIVVPAGSMEEGEDGRPIFHVGRDKVFEVMGKDEIVPQYVTWDGQAQACFEEIKQLIDMILTVAEIPAVALGKDNSGTSGASGLAIKWRMNSLLAKINRKRQYYDKALRRVLVIAQLLEHATDTPDYKITEVKVRFRDGLPDDELEQAQIMSLRLGGKETISQKTAIMSLDGLTEEQADAELTRIQDENDAAAMVSGSVFNETPKTTNKQPPAKN